MTDFCQFLCINLQALKGDVVCVYVFKPACEVFTEKCFISHSVITINENLPDRSEETVELATRAANIGNALLLSEDVCLPRRICYGQRSDIVLKR